MNFYAQNGGNRPIRLSEQTRKFAYESLGRKYGLDTLKTDSISLDSMKNFSALSALEKYDIAILKIAEEAPIRTCMPGIDNGGVLCYNTFANLWSTYRVRVCRI